MLRGRAKFPKVEKNYVLVDKMGNFMPILALKTTFFPTRHHSQYGST